MAVYGQPARTHKNPVQDIQGRWYPTAEAMAKGPKPTPHRDAKAKQVTKFMKMDDALAILRKVT